MGQVDLKAYCKVNLSLDVLGQRTNGYHDVKMIMQTIDVYDEISIKESHSISMTCDIPELKCDDSNLCIKAARLMADEFDLESGVEIDLKKRIPFAAGLGGGSADAAAVIKGINELFDLDLSDGEMMDVAVQVGADVPFFIIGGTALSEGIGEILTPLHAVADYPIIIAKPSIGVSTKYVYDNLDMNTITHPDVDAMIKALDDSDIYGVCSYMGNVLESVTTVKYPVINDIKNIMKANGAINSMMSGSGPSVFGVFPDEEKRDKCMKLLTTMRLAKEVYATRFINE